MAAREFNSRINKNMELDSNQLKTILCNVGLPYSYFYLKTMEAEKLIVKANNKFTFSRHPIPYIEFERIARLTYNVRKKMVSNGEEQAVSKAIALLKSKGYLILKQL